MPGDDGGVQWVQGQQGLDDTIPPGSRSQIALGVQGIARVTPDLLNVKVRFGNVMGRGGMTSYKGAIVTPNGPIIGLMYYNRALSVNNDLLRLTPSRLEILSGSSWSNVTGDALNGTALAQPQYTIQNDILVYTMDGLSRPQGYGTNSGVEVAYAVGTTLGGVPPFAKSIISYMQFLLLGNVSVDGSFTDVFDGWRTIEYSDVPFTSWTSCQGNIIDLYQTPGPLMTMKVLGRVCICYKNDGLIRLTWVGGAVRFTQELIPGAIGTAAPLSVVDLGEFGHAYLGTNGIIYNVTQSAVTAVTYAKLSRTLPPLQKLQRFRYARGFQLPTQDLYILLYDRTGLSGQFLDSYVTWNYRSGEITKGQLGLQVIAGSYFKPTDDGQEVGLVSTSNKVEEFDSDNNTSDDDGISINRYWTTGWHKFADEEGYLLGVIVEMRKAAGCRVKVSLGRNLIAGFEREQIFSLRSLDPANELAECNYRFPAPVFGDWFNVKVRLIHDKPTMRAEMVRIGFISKPGHKYPVSQQQVPSDNPSIGS